MVPAEVGRILSIVERQERWRGSETINLIASENVMSPLARKVFASDFEHRYAEGTIGRRFYEGTAFVDEAEELCVGLFKELSGATYVDVRPTSGTVANMAVYYAFTRPGDLVMCLSVQAGAHISHTSFGSAGFRGLRVSYLPFDKIEMNLDLEGAVQLILEQRPRLIMLGGSVSLFPVPLEEVAEVAEEVGSILCYDAAHVLGLILGGKFQRPLREGVHVMSSSTHKTLPGPQGGVVFTNDESLFRNLQRAIFPGLVSNHHLHRLPSLAVTLAEMKVFGKAYAEQVVKNAKALASALHSEGFDVLCAHKGFTESHQVVIRVAKFGKGDKVARLLAQGNIIVNKNLLPGDSLEDSWNPSGIRLGTQEVTRWGMKEENMRTIAEFMRRIIIDGEDPAKIRRDVTEFRREFTRVHYCFREAS